MNSKEYVEILEAYQGIYEQVGVPIKSGESVGAALNRVSGGKIPADKVIDPKKPTLDKAHYEPDGDVISEEVQIAAQYFYNLGLNEEGVSIVNEELGDDEFLNFIEDIVSDYYLEEGRTLTGKKKSPAPKGSEEAKISRKAAAGTTTKKAVAAGGSVRKLKSLSPEGRVRPKAGEGAEEKRSEAVVKAKETQPKKRPVFDAIARQVTKGMERHRAAMGAARETGKTISNVAGKVGGVAREVGKGVSGAARLAGHLARKGLNDEYIMEYLVNEGYAETLESAEVILANMGEEWRNNITEALRDLFDPNKSVAAQAQRQSPFANQSTKPLPSVSSPFAKPASRNDSGRLTTYGAGGGSAAEKSGKTRAEVMRQGAANLERKTPAKNQGPDFGR